MRLENLHSEEMQAIIFALGNMPTSSNCWPLMQKIAEQFNAQNTDPPEEKRIELV